MPHSRAATSGRASTATAAPSTASSYSSQLVQGPHKFPLIDELESVGNLLQFCRLQVQDIGRTYHTKCTKVRLQPAMLKVVPLQPTPDRLTFGG